MNDGILITGASGNVGREVLRALRSKGLHARAALREPRGEDAVALDFTDPATWDAALEGVGRLFLVRPPAISDVRHTLAPFLDRAQARGVRHVVFLALLGVERNPLTPHARVEKHLRRIGLPFTSLRASFFMQNLDTLHADDLRERDELFVPAGRGKTSFIDVRDLGDLGAHALLTAGSETRAWDLTGSEALDYHQVAALLSRALGRTIHYREPGLWAWRKELRRRGLAPDFVNVMSFIYFVVRMGWAGRVTPLAQELLGRPPRRMEDYARDYAKCFEPAVRSA